MLQYTLPPAASSDSSLLITAPAGSHFAQLHQDTDSLGRHVAHFIDAGIQRDEPVLLVATQSHIKSILHHLRLRGRAISQCEETRQLSILDADWALRQVMVGNTPVWQLFSHVIGTPIQRIRVPHYNARVYGEMVGIMWQQGKYEVARQLERFWCRLQEKQPFAWFCCYLLDRWALSVYDAPLKHLDAVKCPIVPTEADRRFAVAVARAAQEILGDIAARPEASVSVGLPEGVRRMLYVRRMMPAASERILRLAQQLFVADARH